MMQKYTVKTAFGTYNVIILVDHYYSNGNLAIQLFDPDDGPFARLTVNLDDKLPDNQAYVDTNNCPWGPAFIAEHGLGKAVGKTGYSGWCAYPLYEFDMERINGET